MQRLSYSVSVLLSIVALVLLAVNLSLVSGNRAKQNDINQRQGSIASAQPIIQVHRAVVGMMAEAAIRSSDSQMRSLLSAEGISIQPNNNKAPAAKPEGKKE